MRQTSVDAQDDLRWREGPVRPHGADAVSLLVEAVEAGRLAAAISIGAIAGLLPAIRAARLSPTEALRTV
jgi:hypothetical protein